MGTPHDDFGTLVHSLTNMSHHCNNRCGGPSQSSYCSKECMRLDTEQDEQLDHSSDFSPSLSALPALESSAKSDRSSPTSSTNNSPSPRAAGTFRDIGLGEDPPQLDLPAPAHKIQYGGHSLPVTIRYAHNNSNWTVNDTSANQRAHPQQQQHPHHVPLEDLVYRRKPNKPTQSIPAPLYYRERAALVHSSPSLAPSSPSARRVSPPSFWSPQLQPTREITSLALPPSKAASPEAPTPIAQSLKTTHCGRPGCVGVPIPRRPKLDAVPTAIFGSSSRRASRSSAPVGALKAPPSLESSGQSSPATVTADVLLSPRIRALRSEDSGLAAVGMLDLEDMHAGTIDEGEAVPAESVDDGTHSAFACYLFSHLADKSAAVTASAPGEEESEGRGRDRIRTQRDCPTPLDEKRSMSVDAAALASRLTTHVAAMRGRPTRYLFSRGPSAQAASRDVDDAITEVEAEEEPSLDLDATIRGKSEKARRPKLLVPGHLIESATTDSNSPGNSFVPSHSLATSPPTARRGRSAGRLPRRLSNSEGQRERGRSGSRSRSTRRSSRGQVVTAILDDATPLRPARDNEEDWVAVDDDRGRSRSRGRSRGRSQSLLRQGRGREVVWSGAGYGHGSP